MGQALLGDWRFLYDPSSVEWNFTAKTSRTRTVGGEVVQVFGTRITDMTVAGVYGPRYDQRPEEEPWRHQEEFLSWLRRRIDAQDVGAPLRFFMPQRGWDFLVNVTGISEQGGSEAANLTVGNANPFYRLTLHVVRGDASLRRLASDAYIARLSDGLGWKKSAYNGPLTHDEVEAALSGQSVAEYLGVSGQGIPDQGPFLGGGFTGGDFFDDGDWGGPSAGEGGGSNGSGSGGGGSVPVPGVNPN